MPLLKFQPSYHVKLSLKLVPVDDNEKENYIILTNKEIYAVVNKNRYKRDSKVKWTALVWACRENGRKQN